MDVIVVFDPAPGPAAGGLTFSDDFSTVYADKTSDPNWFESASANAGSWSTSGGLLNNNNAGDNQFLLSDQSTIADNRYAEFTFDAWSNAAYGQINCIVDYNDDDNFTAVFWDSNSEIKITDENAGSASETTVATGVTLTGGDVLRIELSGTTAEVFLNTVSQGTATISGTRKGTTVGFRGFGVEDIDIRDFEAGDL